MASSKRQLASALDTAVLVFFLLLLLAVGWWVLKAVVGTLVFFAKLAVLAVVLTVVIRAFLWVRERASRHGGAKPDLT